MADANAPVVDDCEVAQWVDTTCHWDGVGKHTPLPWELSWWSCSCHFSGFFRCRDCSLPVSVQREKGGGITAHELNAVCKRALCRTIVPQIMIQEGLEALQSTGGVEIACYFDKKRKEWCVSFAPTM